MYRTHEKKLKCKTLSFVQALVVNKLIYKDFTYQDYGSDQFDDFLVILKIMLQPLFSFNLVSFNYYLFHCLFFTN